MKILIPPTALERGKNFLLTLKPKTPYLKMIKAIFLDAVGTLFDVRGSVGEIYALLASRWGIEVDAVVLNQAFFNSFKMSPPMAFPGKNPADIPQLEFDWWKAIASQTFQKVGLLEQFSDFSAFFSDLYDYFATVEPWFVYPDAKPALNKWRNSGIELGVVSNFDTRIYPVLKTLNLTDYFATVTISTEAGAAKPDQNIFAAALKKHNCSNEEVWHIGDSFQADYQGATAAGIKGIWLNRNFDKKEQKSNLETDMRETLLDCLK